MQAISTRPPAFPYNVGNPIFKGIAMSDVQSWIKETVTQNPVVLFMKGTPCTLR